ncbi:Alpha/Beta hydrolase protein [Chytriomyces sp. MP71]|nr:Alpha/Beta hydrolase protein [Chytriomyces sp. MP71]
MTATFAEGPEGGRYARIGEGRVPHGFQLWHRLVEPFAHFGDGGAHSVLVLDNRGVGFSEAPRDVRRYTTSAMAADVLELMDSIGWSRAHIVGVSMGGMIAQELAIQRPEVVASLTLTSTHAGRTLPPLKGLVTIPHMLTMKDPAARAAASRDLIFTQEWLEKPSKKEKGKTNREAITAVFMSRSAVTPPPSLNGVLGQLAAVLTHHVSQLRLQTIVLARIPVLVCTGTWDNLILPSNSDFLAKALNAKVYRIFVGGGHAVIEDFCDDYNAMLEQFIADIEMGKK